jgi:dipeptidyl aminopeptidase/acylaminoacyl peptidase
MENKKHIPTIDELIELPEPEEEQISPDGKYVTYTVSKPDWEKNERISQIWLVSTTQPEPRQLTFAKTSSTAPRWSPDGKWLTFLSQRESDKFPQIYRLSPFGGEAERLTEVQSGIQKYAWAPEGGAIAFLMTVPETPEEKQRKESYGDYRIEDEDYKRAQLWLYEVENKKTRQLTGGEDLHILDLDWSPDSKKIAFDYWPNPDIKNVTKEKIAIFDLASREITQLTGIGSSTPRWSPDGTQIAFSYQPSHGYYLNNEIHVMPAGGGEARSITNKFDENVMLQDWGPEGIFFGAILRLCVHLFRIDPQSCEYSQLTPDEPGGWAALGVSFSQDYSLAAMGAFDAEHYKEVTILNTSDKTIQRLTNYNDLMVDWEIGVKERLQWESSDGTPIEGVLYKPDSFDPNKKYPLLVVIHGGPTWTSLLGKLAGPESRFYPSIQWIAKDALILEPNYRGSAGYGENFRGLNVRNLGVGDYWDVISGVDALIEKGWVEPDRVGSMGWSQGGYISAFITTYSDRFKAVSVGAGISNWVTYYVNTDIHPFTREYLEATPWEDMEIYQKTSPMTHIKNAKTPTLIQHGDQDFRVPIPNAYELYQGLVDMGVEAKLVVYPGMPHSTRNPCTVRQIMEGNFEWFNRWIWDQEAEDKEQKPVYIAIARGEMADNPGELAAIERFTGAQVQDVYHWAKRDKVDFYIFSGQAGLIVENCPSPLETPELKPENVSETAQHLARLLGNLKDRKLVLYTPVSKENPWVFIHLGCLQVAAGMVEDISIEHIEISDEGW